MIYPVQWISIVPGDESNFVPLRIIAKSGSQLGYSE